MPPRTNPFQQLIAFITRAVAPSGARVSESRELAEYDGSTLREVDILIEHEIAGHPVRIGIECRDHTRKQDKTWVDELCGKYRDLGVPIVIAVSKSGFTQGALEKAARVGIRALTLDEALDEDWQNALLKPRIRFGGNVCELAAVVLHYAPGTQPPSQDDGVLDWIIQGPAGEESETVEATALRLYTQDSDAQTEAYVIANGLRDFANPKDVDFEFSITYEASLRYAVAPGSAPLPLRALELRLKAGVRFLDANHEHFKYESSLVTVASASIEGGDRASVALVQPLEPKNGRIAVTWGLLEPRADPAGGAG